MNEIRPLPAFLTSKYFNVNVTHGIAGIRIANGGEITFAIFE